MIWKGMFYSSVIQIYTQHGLNGKLQLGAWDYSQDRVGSQQAKNLRRDYRAADTPAVKNNVFVCAILSVVGKIHLWTPVSPVGYD